MVRVLLCLLLAAAAPAQTEKHPELGMTFTGPGGYERLPVRPRERFGALSYVDRAGAAERPATLDVFVVPRGGDVANARAFVEDVLRGAAVEVLRVGRSRYGYEPARFAFEVTEDGSTVAGWAHAWEGPARSYLVVGRCEPGELAAQRSSWTRSAEDLRLFEPTDGSAERRKWERYYGGRRGLTGVERRIQARLALVDGWRMRDTAHYVVLSHGVDEGFVIQLATEVETLREQLSATCPSDGALDAVSVVRICRDRAEYLAYGGSAASVGYWSPLEGELVLFDARAEVPQGLDGEHYTRSVLFHEAFHQYVHYAAEGIAPHSWFDEGLAEVYGGARVEGRRFSGLEPNRYRLHAAQALLVAGAYPWEATTAMEQAEFYADATSLYAQGWSMAHFLVTSPEARRHPRWRTILPTYFRTLRGAWIAERHDTYHHLFPYFERYA